MNISLRATLEPRARWRIPIELALLVIAGVVVGTVGACDPNDRGSQPASSASPPASASAAAVTPSPAALATPSAFDVAVDKLGAAIVWGDRAGMLRLRRFGSDGELPSAPEVLAARGGDARITELAVHAHAERMGVAWVELETNSDRARIHSSIVAMDPRDRRATPAPVVMLSETWGAQPERGNVALTALEDGRFLALVRAEPEPCHDAAARNQQCVRVAFRHLQGTQTDSRPGLSLPRPCASPIVGITAVGAHRHYAVCDASSGKPVTTLFTARYRNVYAQSETLLRDCKPAALVTLDSQVALTARCSGAIRLGRVDGIAPVDVATVTTSLACEDRALALTTSGGDRFTIPRPTRGLALLLPSDLQRVDARAIWTGEALLVVYPTAGALRMARHRCHRGLLVSDGVSDVTRW